MRMLALAGFACLLAAPALASPKSGTYVCPQGSFTADFARDSAIVTTDGTRYVMDAVPDAEERWTDAGPISLPA